MSSNTLSALLASPLSLYSIPVVWATAMYPCVAKVALIQKYTGYNNVSPRGNVTRMKSKHAVPDAIAEKAARLEAAHFNGNEILPVWIAAVLVGNYAKLNASTLNAFSVAFIAARIYYNHAYANQATRAQSFKRSASWWVSVIISMSLIIKGANKIRVAQ